MSRLLLSPCSFFSVIRVNKVLLLPVGVGLILGVTGCGKKPEPALPEPEVIVQPPSANKSAATPASTPESTPTPQPTPTPAPTPLPPPEPVADSIQEPIRQVYVVTAFQSVSDIGTHDFPQGAKVNLLAIEGEDYLVELGGVSVKNNKIFFSETEVLAVVPEATTTTQPELTPPSPLPTPEAPTTLTPEDKKIGDLSDKIRLLDEEVRAAKEKAAEEVTSGASSSSSSRDVEKLKKERDRLSEELSDIAKP